MMDRYMGLDNPPTEIQKLIAGFYDTLSPQIALISQRAFEEDALGEGYQGYLLLSDIWLLLAYLIIINKEMEEFRATSECGALPPRNYYIEKYGLDCIRKTFLCKGITIDKILKLDMLPAYQVFDLGANASDTGIGFMYIEGSDTPSCESKETFTVS